MTELALTKPRILPPKGLLFALAGQLPLLVASGSLRPSAPEIVGGGLLLGLGVILNDWPERLCRRHDVGVCPFTHIPGLVARGPYRLTRNPMYVGLVCLNVGVTLICRCAREPVEFDRAVHLATPCVRASGGSLPAPRVGQRI